LRIWVSSNYHQLHWIHQSQEPFYHYYQSKQVYVRAFQRLITYIRSSHNCICESAAVIEWLGICIAKQWLWRNFFKFIANLPYNLSPTLLYGVAKFASGCSHALRIFCLKSHTSLSYTSLEIANLILVLLFVFTSLATAAVNIIAFLIPSIRIQSVVKATWFGFEIDAYNSSMETTRDSQGRSN
jgi:hypothetical protein